MKIKRTIQSLSEKFELSRKLNRLYFVSVILLLFFAYLPSLQYDFAYNDQWRAFQYSLLDESSSVKALKCFASRLPYDFMSGRPLLCIGECIEHSFVGKISDFSSTRPIMFILVVVTAFCVGLALSPSVGGIANGTAIGALFVLSPGYAHMYYLGFTSLMMFIGIILATLSYVFIRQAINENIKKDKLLLSSALFFLACMSYPAWAFMVFMFCMLDFLLCRDIEFSTRLKYLFIRTFFFVSIAAIYYLFIKFIIGLMPAYNLGNYEFSANLSPVYIIQRYFVALIYFLAQPPLNTLYSSLRILNIIFLSVVAAVFTFLLFSRRQKSVAQSTVSFLIITLMCFFLILISIFPWLASQMPFPQTRYFITFSLLMCTLAGWIIYRIATQFFPGKEYISSILILVMILLPASAIQNKRTAIEVGIKGTEIETMRWFVHKWIDESKFLEQRYVIVVKPERPRPLYYDSILNNVVFGESLRNLNWRRDDPLLFSKILSELMKRENNSHPIGVRLLKIMSLGGYGESLEFCGDPTYYFQMFTALIREKCDHDHLLARKMNIYNFSFTPGQSEEVLDDSSLNIVFTVINQGGRIETKHEYLEINFSLITNHPEKLITNREID